MRADLIKESVGTRGHFTPNKQIYDFLIGSLAQLKLLMQKKYFSLED